jgi:ring-1,2-phenylacetyl-CoA epoxidase subunit PaaE
METRIQLKINDICKETSDAFTLQFEPTKEPIPYYPGQFLTLIAQIDGKEIRRAYSLSSSPYADPHLSVTIKRVTGGRMSNYLLDHLSKGDCIEALAPAGNFYLKRSYVRRNLVLIAGGSGITPLFSMIKSVLTLEAHSVVTLIYVNSCKEKTIFYEALESLAFRYQSRFLLRHYWSADRKGWLSKIFRHSHRLNATRLRELFRELGIQRDKNPEFYLCGPQGLMKLASATIESLGFPKELIQQEHFYIPTKIKNDRPYSIKIKMKGKEHIIQVNPGTSILHAGLEAGLDLPYSCQSGACNTCAVKCTSGKVGMSSTEGLSPKLLKEGYVMACVGYPLTEDVCLEY